MFSLYKSLYNMRPPGQGHIRPQGHNLIKIGVKVHLMILNIKALGLVVSDKKGLFMFPYVKHVI